MKQLFVAMLALVLIAPAGFAQQQKPVKKETAAKKVYTCPMHPEVKSDKPGKCPKCGMTLEEKKKPAPKVIKKDSM